jgi:putative oxidoreductase
MANRPTNVSAGAGFGGVAVNYRQLGTPNGVIILVGRVLFAAIFILAGPKNFQAAAIAHAVQNGVPLARIAVPLSGVFALLGGLSILLGFRAKIGAWLIVLFLIPVTPAMHNFWAVSDPMMMQDQLVHFMKNLAMLGGALLITQFGAGSWSIDARAR